MYYLAKSGKVSGPFDAHQFEQLKRSGEIDQYSWYWEPKSDQWTPIDPPPLNAPVNAANSTTKKSRKITTHLQHFEVICYDYKELASGKLRTVSEFGCEIIIPITEGHLSPIFSERAPLLLNVLDEKSNQAMDVPANVNSISREGMHWVYRVRWNTLPQIVELDRAG